MSRSRLATEEFLGCRRCRGSRALVSLLLTGTVAWPAAATVEDPSASMDSPRRVLIIQSFGADFPPLGQVASTLRSELVRGLREPFDIHEISLEHARSEDDQLQWAFVAYLNALYGARPPALVVTLGGPAARFGQRYREQLFPGVPVLFAAVDLQVLGTTTPGAHDATVPTSQDLPGTVEALLQLMPATEQLAVVVGSSPLERFWRERLGEQLAPFEGRLRLLWLDGLSLDQIRERVATLPPRSAVFFVLLLVDGVGVPHSQERALAAICQVANAPVIGLFSSQIGHGVLGGQVLPVIELGESVAEAASRLLRGEAPAAVRYPPLRADRRIYDERELVHWGVPISSVLAGSEIRFRRNRPPPWTAYRWQILGGLAVVALQATLIAALVIHRARRRAAEKEVRALHGSLLTTYEQERGRLARELHDDVTQRLARLALDSGQMARQRPTAGESDLATQMHRDLVRLTDDVQVLSRHLHPSVLLDLGIVEALRSEADRFAAAHALTVEQCFDSAPPELAPDVALCFYRVAQEALRNVARHAEAGRVEISLARLRDRVELAVRDDGKGFSPEAARSRGGLGLISLRERLHLVGGRLTVISAPGRGTTVLAWAPIAKEAS